MAIHPLAVRTNLMVAREEKSERVLLWGTSMSVENLKTIHPIVFSAWTKVMDQLTDSAIPRASPLEWLIKIAMDNSFSFFYWPDKNNKT